MLSFGYVQNPTISQQPRRHFRASHALLGAFATPRHVLGLIGRISPNGARLSRIFVEENRGVAPILVSRHF